MAHTEWSAEQVLEQIDRADALAVQLGVLGIEGVAAVDVLDSLAVAGLSLAAGDEVRGDGVTLASAAYYYAATEEL